MSGNLMDTMASILGGGLMGGQPSGGIINVMVGSNDRSQKRILLRQAFGNKRVEGLTNAPLVVNNDTSLTPFRRAFNAGDVYNTTNKAPRPELARPSNQVNNIKPSSLVGLNAKIGGTRQVANGSAYVGHPKYVYDSSTYTRYKNLRAQNKTYNDASFGGDESNASYSFINRVRN